MDFEIFQTVTKLHQFFYVFSAKDLWAWPNYFDMEKGFSLF